MYVDITLLMLSIISYIGICKKESVNGCQGKQHVQFKWIQGQRDACLTLLNDDKAQ